MRWMIAAAFLIQPASASLAAQETPNMPIETLPHNRAVSSPRVVEPDLIAPTAAASRPAIATGTNSITNEDIASFLNEEPEALTKPNTIAEGADGMLLKLVAVLCFVLMFCAFLAVRHGRVKAGLTGAGSGPLSLVASLPLPNRSVLHLVSASGSMLVVASDSGGVKSVTRLPEQFDDLVDAAQPHQMFAESEVGRA